LRAAGRPDRRFLASLAVLTGLAGIAHADAPPRLLSAPDVEAPTDASLPPDASIVLRITIDATGTVSEVEVVQGLRADVDARVVEAARQMRFAPAERAGQAVPARIRFRFRLRPAAPAAPAVPTTSTTSASPAVPENPFAPAPPTAPPRTGPRRQPSEGGVTVRGRHEPGAATRLTFRAEELTTVPGTFGEPTRVVASLPGVARTPFGLGFFVVRGASFENTGFFVDGFPVLLLYHLGAGPAVISSRLVGQMDFYPGGYPLQFGRFSAGVISLETRPPPTDRPRAEFEVDVLRASALGVMPTADGRGSVAVAVRRSYYDFLLPLLAPGVVLNYGDAQLRGDYRFSDRLTASLFAFASTDTFDRTEATGQGATAASARDALAYTFGRLIGKLEYREPAGVVAQWSAMLGFDDTSLVQADPGQPDRGLRASGAVVGQRFSVRVPTGHTLTTTVGVDALGYIYEAGFSSAQSGGIGAVPAPGANPRVITVTGGVTQHDVTPYVEGVVRSGPLEFTSGTRLAFLTYQGHSHVVADPRMVARLRVRPDTVVIGSTGLFHQAPPFFGLLPQFGNPNLLPQRAWQSSLGIELDLPFDIEARLTGFFNRMWQLPRATYSSNYARPTQDGAGRAFAVSDGEGRAYGLEVLIRRKLQRGVYGWLSYTLSRSERFIGEGRVVPFTYDQTHVLNLAASWDIDRRWRLGARFQLATVAPTSRIDDAIYDADADSYRPVYQSEADRLPTYHQLDVRVDYRFRAGPLEMSAYLDVLNAYWAQNAEGWVYQYDYADRRPRAGIPILPTLGIRGEL
jgi:TonB family protein